MSVQSDFDALAALVASLRPKPAKTITPAYQLKLDLWADVDFYVQAVRWALKFEPALTPAEEGTLSQVLAIGLQRAKSLEAGKTPWHKIAGRVMRGFVSEIDGSTQPFSLHIPANFNWKKKSRLDVVLDGSRNARALSFAIYLQRFSGLIPLDKMPTPPIDGEPDYIQMTPLARVENAYRHAGEKDVFEAIEATCRNYPIDRDRIVLRGMSAGATGTWHIGLKHPSTFVALGPYCGYVDTHRFSYAPIDHFPRIDSLPAHQEKTLHTLDSVDYAANVGVVPVIAAVGAHDPFVDAHTIMNEAVRKEGNQLINLVSPFTQHSIDPVTHKLMMKMIGEHVTRGLDHFPREIRFVTWTLRYGKCHWIELLGLHEQFARTEIIARVTDNGVLEIQKHQNIRSLAIDLGIFGKKKPRIIIEGQEIKLGAESGFKKSGRIVLEEEDGAWSVLAERLVAPTYRMMKRPGIQGPIDDAFVSPFVCVRGTGKPWNEPAGVWANACLDRFADEWARYWRGELPIKDDDDITDADIRGKNLVLFGDPGSNSVLRDIAGALAIKWTAKRIVAGERKFDARTHAPLFIHPNPLEGADDRYVVVNSGHTFRGKDSATINYLLFPRLGDWAVMKISADAPLDATGKIHERVACCGFFNERWGFDLAEEMAF